MNGIGGLGGIGGIGGLGGIKGNIPKQGGIASLTGVNGLGKKTDATASHNGSGPAGAGLAGFGFKVGGVGSNAGSDIGGLDLTSGLASSTPQDIGGLGNSVKGAFGLGGVQ